MELITKSDMLGAVIIIGAVVCLVAGVAYHWIRDWWTGGER